MIICKFALAWIGVFSLIAVTLVGCTRKTAPDDILHVDQHFSFPKEFHPDPGNAGKKTLEGIDSDHDGLRDDVQRWIYARYPNDEKKRKALRQMALSYQDNLRPNLKDTDLKAILLGSDRAIVCLYQIFPSNVDSTSEREYVRAKVLNTHERTEQFLRLDARFDGKTLGPSYPDDGTACDQ